MILILLQIKKKKSNTRNRTVRKPFNCVQTFLCDMTELIIPTGVAWGPSLKYEDVVSIYEIDCLQQLWLTVFLLVSGFAKYWRQSAWSFLVAPCVSEHQQHQVANSCRRHQTKSWCTLPVCQSGKKRQIKFHHDQKSRMDAAPTTRTINENVRMHRPSSTTNWKKNCCCCCHFPLCDFLDVAFGCVLYME